MALHITKNPKIVNEFLYREIETYYGTMKIVEIISAEYENTPWPEYKVKVISEFGTEFNGTIEVNYPQNKLSFWNKEDSSYVWFK